MMRNRFLNALLASTGPAVVAAATPAPAQAALDASEPWMPPHFPILLRGEYDYDGMIRALTADTPHKQVFLSNPPLLTGNGIAGLFQKMSLAWTSYEFALVPKTRVKLAMTAVLIAAPVVFALNDAMWAKYRIASILGLRDRDGRIRNENFTRKAWSNLDLNANPESPTGIYHDFTSDALRTRGAGFLVCHNAMAGTAVQFAKRRGVTQAAVLDDWTRNLLPGFVAVPSGAMAVQLAQERGYRLYPVTD